MSIDLIRHALAAQGLLLCKVMPVGQLPANVWLSPPATHSRGSLLVVGNAGSAFWPAFKASTPADTDPVDGFSAEITEALLEQYLPDTPRQRLFPAIDCPVNLMSIGRALGWHTPSPLGMGIHADYGLWTAFRAVWWLDGCFDTPSPQAPVCSASSDVDVCTQCTTHACIQACPAQAVSWGNPPDLGRCADYRLSESGRCASTCLARMACPVAAEHRYSAEQMAYHYELARSAIQRYRRV